MLRYNNYLAAAWFDQNSSELADNTRWFFSAMILWKPSLSSIPALSCKSMFEDQRAKNTFVSCKRNAGDVLPCSPSNSNPFAQNFNNPELPKHISQISFQKPSLYCHLFICSDFVMDYLQTCVLDEEGEPDFNRSATFFDQIENAGRGSLLIVQVTWK